MTMTVTKGPVSKREDVERLISDAWHELVRIAEARTLGWVKSLAEYSRDFSNVMLEIADGEPGRDSFGDLEDKLNRSIELLRAVNLLAIVIDNVSGAEGDLIWKCNPSDMPHWMGVNAYRDALDHLVTIGAGTDQGSILPDQYDEAAGGLEIIAAGMRRKAAELRKEGAA